MVSRNQRETPGEKKTAWGANRLRVELASLEKGGTGIKIHQKKTWGETCERKLGGRNSTLHLIGNKNRIGEKKRKEKEIYYRQ